MHFVDNCESCDDVTDGRTNDDPKSYKGSLLDYRTLKTFYMYIIL